LAESQHEATLRIGDVARHTGVSVSTLRSWEQRYGLLAPARSPGGHRRYRAEDLRRIGAVRLLVSEGATMPAAAQRVMHATGGAPGARSGKPAPVGDPLPTAGLDREALEAAYRATRSLLHISQPADALDLLVRLVRELGGEVADPGQGGPDALPLDLDVEGVPPLVAVAEPISVAQLRLERILPTVVDDAHRAVALLRNCATDLRRSTLLTRRASSACESESD
jgi:hypothetical protein